jgi:predicted DNA-binding transcriptional regulator AlpA
MTRETMKEYFMQQTKLEPLQTTFPALSQFSEMPSASFIRLPVVALLYGHSPATVWRNCKKGLMPSPVKISERVTAWNVGQIKADLASKMESK